MTEEARPAGRGWLTEEHGGGFAELVPSGPVMSVTITPKGKCYRLAKDVIARLARIQNSVAKHKPHITIQGIYEQERVEEIARHVSRLAEETPPFCVNVGGLGLLESPGDPGLLHLHLHVERSPELVDLYARLKADLEGLGVRTYPFSPDEWVPHLTLASGRWSRRDLLDLLEETGPNLPDCVMPLDQLELNRLTEDGTWQTIGRFALTGVRAG